MKKFHLVLKLIYYIVGFYFSSDDIQSIIKELTEKQQKNNRKSTEKAQKITEETED